MATKGVKLSEEHKRKIGLGNKGKVRSLEVREKIRQTNLRLGITWPIHKMVGDKHPLWKGGSVGYYALHSWVRRTYGKASHCEQCGKIGKKINGKWNIEWALIKGKKYGRNRDNFWMLCAKCHINYDKDGRPEPWNKGMKGKQSWMNLTGLKLGIGWNKGLAGRYKLKSRAK